MSLSALCLECGLCCDGTLFRQVTLVGPEREALAALRVGVGKKRGHDVMPLPCGKLEGRCCTVYAQRPGGCRRFVCALGRRLEAGEVGFDEALARVRGFQAKVAQLSALAEAPPGENARGYARALVDTPTARVSDELLRALREVEAERTRLFVPPPG